MQGRVVFVGFFCKRLQEDLSNMIRENHEQIFLSCYVSEMWACRERPGN